MTAKKPAAPTKALPVTEAKAKLIAAPVRNKPIVAAAAAKGKPAPKAVALVKAVNQPASRATAKVPAAPPPGKRGGKAVPEPARKLPDMPADEDFADLEADAEVTAAV